MKKLLALLLLVSSFANAGQITGTITTATSGPIQNGTLTLTPTQAFVVAGTATVVSSPVACYTDGNGNVVGEPNPLVAPTVTPNTASGTLAAGTYFIRFTYYDASGESVASFETTTLLGSTGTLIVTPPTRQPATATGYKIYISTVSSSETLQSTQVGFPTYQQSSALIAGSALPSSNTSACKPFFNDQGSPVGGYNVTLTNSSGATVSGFPQKWQLMGGAAGTVNLSNGTPLWNGFVQYPQAIVTTPAFNASQSIAGPLNIGAFPFTAGSVNGLFNASRFATISAALSSAVSSGQQSVAAPCANYSDNILDTTGAIDIFGASNAQNCSIFQPLIPATDLFKIDATTTGLTSGTAFRNFDVNCPSGTCGNMVTITGSQVANQPNDWLNFRHIYSSQFGINSTGTAGFANGISITGRTIFSTFDNLRINATRGDGFNVTLTGGAVGPFNANWINSSVFQGNFGYGMRFNTTGGTTLSEAISITNTDIESNGQNASLSPCAGVLITGVSLINFFHSAFEGNCPSSSDTNSAQARITGSTSVPFFSNFIGTDFNMTTGAARYGIFADATRSGGVILGNRMAGVPAGASIHIAAASMDSLWEIGVNQSFGKMDVVPDASLNTHVTAPAFGVPGDYTLIGPATECPTTGGTFDLVNGCSQNHQLSNIAFNGASGTWSNFTNAISGSFLYISAFTNNGYTLTNAAGGAGQLVMRDGQNITLNQNDAIIFRLDGNGSWQEMTRSYITTKNIWKQTQTLGRIVSGGTTTPACSVTGAGASGSCAPGSGSTDSYGVLVISAAGAGPAASGTLTITFSSALGGGSGQCIFQINGSNTAWNIRGAFQQTSIATTSVTANWDNNAVALVAASSYNVNYVCYGR